MQAIVLQLAQETVLIVVVDVTHHVHRIVVLLAKQLVTDVQVHAVEDAQDVDHVVHHVAQIVIQHVVILVKQHVLD